MPRASSDDIITSNPTQEPVTSRSVRSQSASATQRPPSLVNSLRTRPSMPNIEVFGSGSSLTSSVDTPATIAEKTDDDNSTNGGGEGVGEEEEDNSPISRTLSPLQNAETKDEPGDL